VECFFVRATRLSPRSQRGLELAKSKHQLFRRIAKDTWLVPSATNSDNTYVVSVPRPSCTCPGFDESGRCTHVLAVAYLSNEITLIDGTRLTPPPVIDAATLTALALKGGS
jgi:hypothetical protein